MISYWLAVILFVLGWAVFNVVTYHLPTLLKRPSWENAKLGAVWFIVCFLGLGIGLIVTWQYVPAVYVIEKGGREYYYGTMKLFTEQSTMKLNQREVTISASLVTESEPDIVVNNTPEAAFVERYSYSTSFSFGDPYSKRFEPFGVGSCPEVSYFGKDRPPESISTKGSGTITHHWLFVKGEDAK